MPKRALLFLGAYALFLISAVVFPPSGIWGYLFEHYNHPPSNWWGKSIAGVFGERWSFIIGGAMGLGLLLHYKKYSAVPLLLHGQTKLLLLYTINAAIVTLQAYNPAASWAVTVEHIKMLFVYICLVKTNSEKKYINILIIICMFGCINWGIDTTFNPPRGRGLKISAPSLSDENHVAAHVAALLPLVALYAITGTGWVKYACVLGAPLMMNILAYASSRGAFLALIGAGLCMTVFSKKKLRRWVILCMIAGSIIGLRLFHHKFWERQETITSYSEDASAVGRIQAWKAAWALFKEKPIGYGGEGFDSGLGAIAMAQNGDSFHTTHNLFFEVLVAWGAQGCFFLYSLIILSIADCFKLYKGWWNGEAWPPPQEAIIAFGVMCGLCSMLVSSIFLNRFRWELWWIFAGVCVCLKNIRKFESEKKAGLAE